MPVEALVELTLEVVVTVPVAEELETELGGAVMVLSEVDETEVVLLVDLEVDEAVEEELEVVVVDPELVVVIVVVLVVVDVVEVEPDVTTVEDEYEVVEVVVEVVEEVVMEALAVAVAVVVVVVVPTGAPIAKFVPVNSETVTVPQIVSPFTEDATRTHPWPSQYSSTLCALTAPFVKQTCALALPEAVPVTEMS